MCVFEMWAGNKTLHCLTDLQWLPIMNTTPLHFDLPALVMGV